jgi:hypothetical protein
MSLFSNAKLHMEQYVKTAGSHIVVHWDFLDRSMMLKCLECKSCLVAPKPDDPTEVRYDVQEFVKLHGHHQCSLDTTGYAPSSWKPQINKAALAEVTGGQMVDKDITKSNQIHAAMKAYQKEIAEKKDDAALAKKIAELQAVTPEQKAEAQKLFQEKQELAQKAANEAAILMWNAEMESKAAAEKAKQDAFKDLLKRKIELEAKLAELEKEKAARPRALMSKTGRKFR